MIPSLFQGVGHKVISLWQYKQIDSPTQLSITDPSTSVRTGNEDVQGLQSSNVLCPISRSLLQQSKRGKKSKNNSCPNHPILRSFFFWIPIATVAYYKSSQPTLNTLYSVLFREMVWVWVNVCVRTSQSGCWCVFACVDTCRCVSAWTLPCIGQ